MSSSSSSDRLQEEAKSPGLGFVRASVKSVIKALSGRRQSPSPSFHRSLAEVDDGAEKADRDDIGVVFQFPTTATTERPRLDSPRLIFPYM